MLSGYHPVSFHVPALSPFRLLPNLHDIAVSKPNAFPPQLSPALRQRYDINYGLSNLEQRAVLPSTWSDHSP